MARVLVECTYPRWPALEPSLRRAVLAALAGVPGVAAAEVGVLLTDDAEVRRLNREWRGIDRATNVLSFPMDEVGAAPAGVPLMLGDAVLAYETVAEQARQREISLEHHAIHLVVHGVLHLLGFDHERSEAEATAQESRECAILAGLGVADPYA